MIKPRIALVIGSTRPSRFADKPAQWLLAEAAKRDDLSAEILDLRDFDLPFFDEMASEMWMPSQSEAAQRWQKAVAGFDAFIFLVAEYNHSITGALKNALDQAYTGWVRKPFSAFGYGGVGAARAVEHLRTIGVELQMAPVKSAIHLAGGEFMKVHPMAQGAEMSAVAEVLAPSVKATFDDLVWWANALSSARAAARAKAA
ncbi:MAG: NAD(P)H-dependent oxidoreductase [Proteobacteria bacterium]|nr:NAD(P)H-dependent oxidoreductase [Pseudomonadota bacterium]